MGKSEVKWYYKYYETNIYPKRNEKKKGPTK